jgi:hypothetical protein
MAWTSVPSIEKEDFMLVGVQFCRQCTQSCEPKHPNKGHGTKHQCLGNQLFWLDLDLQKDFPQQCLSYRSP